MRRKKKKTPKLSPSARTPKGQEMIRRAADGDDWLTKRDFDPWDGALDEIVLEDGTISRLDGDPPTGDPPEREE